VKRPPSPLPDNYFRRELALFHRVFSSGNEAGLLDVLEFCKRFSLPLPEWATDACIVRQREFIAGDDKRHAEWKSQYRQDMIDMARAEMVRECRDHKAKWREAYEFASEFLAGTEYEGRPGAMKDSYLKYTDTMKTNPLRYYISNSSFLRLPERRTPINLKTVKWLGKEIPFSEWLDKKFPFPKEGGPRRRK